MLENYMTPAVALTCKFGDCILNNPNPLVKYGVIAIIIIVVCAAAYFIIRALTSKKPAQGKKSSIPESKPGLVEIYVGNLSYNTTDESLRKEFARFGVVKSARVITHRVNGKSKGYGFVEMPHRKEAMFAIKGLDNTEVMGRRVRVNEARVNTRSSGKKR